MEEALEKLRELETRYVGLELREPPFESQEFDVAVDAVLVHEPRDTVFLIDIPYTEEALDHVGEKIESIREELQRVDRSVYYAAINTLDSREAGHIYRADEIEEEVKSAAGIVSPDEVADLYTPRIPSEREYGDGFVEVCDTAGLGFQLKVSSEDDIEHSIEVSMPVEAATRFRENAMNSRKDFGNIATDVFRQRIIVEEDCRIRYGEVVEPLDSYRDSVRSIYQKAVNPCLAKKANSVY